MAILHGDLKHSILPYALAGATLLTAMGAIYGLTPRNQVVEPQIETQIVQVQPQTGLEAKLAEQVSKPATLEEVGGPEGITHDYIVHVAKWAAQELGYSLDPDLKISFLKPEDYATVVKNRPNNQLILNSQAFITSDGMNIYVKDNGKPYSQLGFTLNETGKAIIGGLRVNKKINMPAREHSITINEAGAFAYQALAQETIEKQLGFENMFVPPSYYEMKDLRNQFEVTIKSYFERNNETSGGYMVLIYTSVNQFDLRNLNRAELFEFLLKQDDIYVKNSLTKIGENEFSAMASEILRRRGRPLINPLTFYDDKLP